MKYIYSIKVTTANKNNFVLIQKFLSSFSLIKIVSLPKKVKKFVFFKSPHVNQVAKEHFQSLKYNRIFYVCQDSDAFLKNSLLNFSNTLSLKVIKKSLGRF